MILRPVTDSDLIEAIAEVCSDPRLSLDTRAMLALLFARRDLTNCPTKDALAGALIEFGRSENAPGEVRMRRLFAEAKSAGYMRQATWKVPKPRHRPIYSHVIGLPEHVAAFAAGQIEAEGGA